jgi:hypothetical protein
MVVKFNVISIGLLGLPQLHKVHLHVQALSRIQTVHSCIIISPVVSSDHTIKLNRGHLFFNRSFALHQLLAHRFLTFNVGRFAIVIPVLLDIPHILGLLYLKTVLSFP